MIIKKHPMIQPWIQLGTSWQNPQCAPFWSPWSRRSHLWVPWVDMPISSKYLFANVPCKIRFKGNNLHICQDELKWDQMTYHIPAVEQTDCHILAWGHLFFFKNTSFSGISSSDESDLPFLGLHFTIWFSGWKHARVISSTGSAWES